MINKNPMRLPFVKQILRTMDSLFEMDGESEIWVDGRQWYIYLPEDEPNQVLLRFDHKIENGHAADLAFRFAAIAGLLGLEVYPAADIYPDSTNSVAGLIANVNKN
jgi:hypothetical protein